MPSKKGTHEEALWSNLHTRSSVTFRTMVCARHYFIFFFFSSRRSRLHSPSTCHEILLPADPALALIVKARCAERGAGTRADEGTGKGTWKWKATFRASRCGEGPPATKDDRTLRASARAHRDRHVLFKVTGPPTPHSRPFAQRRPGALYWNSADRLSWLWENVLFLSLSLSLFLLTHPLELWGHV